MSRWVVPRRAGLKAGEGEPPSGRLERIAKYVPGEILSGYTVIYGLLVSYNGGAIDGATQDRSQLVTFATILVIFIFFIGTIIYIRTNPDKYSRKAHFIVTPLAYLAWVYPISSALLGTLFHGLIAILLQAVVLVLALLIDPKDPGPQ